MTKEQMEKELSDIIKESNELYERSQLELATADFLKLQTDALMNKSQNPNLTVDERELVCKQMESLQGKLANEIRNWKACEPRMKFLAAKFEHLQSQIIEE